MVNLVTTQLCPYNGKAAIEINELLGNNRILFVDIDYISYNFNLSQNILILIFFQLFKNMVNFPCGPEAKTLCCQCREPRFDPWLGN